MNFTGIGWWQLFRHPDQLDRLRRDPALLPRAVDELLRYDTPLQMFERWVLEDVEIARGRGAQGGRAGAAVRLGQPRPGRLRRTPTASTWPARRPPSTSASGPAIHYCLGAPLGRLELELSFGTLLRPPARGWSRPPSRPGSRPTSCAAWRPSMSPSDPETGRLRHVRARLHLPRGAAGRPGRPGVAGGGRRGRGRRPLRRRHQPPARGPVRPVGHPRHRLPGPRRLPAVAGPRRGRPAGPQGGRRRRRADAGRRDRAGPGAAGAGGPHRGRGRGDPGGAGRRPHHRPARRDRGGPPARHGAGVGGPLRRPRRHRRHPVRLPARPRHPDAAADRVGRGPRRPVPPARPARLLAAPRRARLDGRARACAASR